MTREPASKVLPLQSDKPPDAHAITAHHPKHAKPSGNALLMFSKFPSPMRYQARSAVLLFFLTHGLGNGPFAFKQSCIFQRWPLGPDVHAFAALASGASLVGQTVV